MDTKLKQVLISYYAAVLPFCQKQKVVELLANLGIATTEPTIADCLLATEEFGVNFTQPFGAIAHVAINSPRYEANVKALKQHNLTNNMINKATDENGNNKLTNDQKVELADSIIGGITDLFKYGSDIFNKDANLVSAQAQLEYQKAQQQKSTNQILTIALVVVGIIVALIVTVALTSKRK